MVSQLKNIAARYALALYELADEQKSLDGLAEDFTSLRHVIAESQAFVYLIYSPILSCKDQTKGVLAICEKFCAKQLTSNFLQTLTYNRRLSVLPEIINAYLEKLAQQRGEVAAEVISAVPLSENDIKTLANALYKRVGQKALFDLKVDPSLIGGLIVRVGSRMIDTSLRTKLRRLRFAMKGFS
ncbi:ATP synthase F1, delta subunit [Candidatus Endolissoclinum faulkneri L2]|uniref:ATP synthase subunit delta n=1 Tax=Candidatus Endolissoclinum faulkneri L2 TaxID=1193729 RepID=K7ZCS1_9PROT|nr:F0F1 ATP synthase subunit delta [Candidatus Endolissoclinum faulkneri]AFX98861.1 ATP synthase F1, delta subunit [Candidatus Endolissoclinum faulkneri L2]